MERIYKFERHFEDTIEHYNLACESVVSTMPTLQMGKYL